MGLLLIFEDYLKSAAVFGLENTGIVGKDLILACDLLIGIVEVEPEIKNEIMIYTGFL